MPTRNKKIFLVLYIAIIFTSCASITHELLEAETHEPEWLDDIIITEEEYIYSVGHSQPRKNEKEARNEALADATGEFVKYCKLEVKVDVQSFDRSIELYSKGKREEIYSSDFQALSVMRSKAFVSRVIQDDWYIRGKKNKFIASVLLKIPREEFDRISNERNIKLSLDILFYYEDENGNMKMFSEGDVLKSGDGFAIYVRASDDCYIYVYQVDALQKSYRLFPNPDFNTKDNPILPANDIWIPNTEQLFELDETTGKEYLYVFASPDRIESFEGKQTLNLKKKDIEDVIKIKKMGIAGLKQKRDTEKVVPPKHSEQVANVKKKLQAEGAFVYETWFWHR